MISDTHGLVRPEVAPAFEGVELILHAGDIGAPQVLDALRAIARVIAVRGNVDVEGWCREIPEQQTTSVGDVTIHMLHDVHALGLDPAAAGIHVVVSGHSHRPAVERRNGILFVNPGSAGPRRFTLPVSVARLSVTGAAVVAELVTLTSRGT